MIRNRARTTVALICLALASSFLHAQSQPQPQSIAGIWQGTLTIGTNSTRAAFTVQKKPDGSFHGGLAWVDRGASVPLDTITLSGSNVTFAQPFMGLTFQGKLSADGKSIDGTWTQGKQSYPLTLALAAPDTLWKHEGRAPQPPMAANADPAFEVATLKPRDMVAHGVSFDLQGHPFIAYDVSALELIKIAYNVRGRQVIGGPSWLNQIAYDVTAVPDTPGVPSEDQGRLMVRKLLVERFHLVSHTEQQPFPTMALTLDPKGPHPTPSDPQFNGHGAEFVRQDGSDMVHQFSGATIQQLVDRLMTFFQDKQVIDDTGLTGMYDITLRMPASVEQSPRNGGPDDERPAAWIAAVEHAGFKFVSKKAPLTVIIVDHIDPPTPN
jgi:uncharacterized protein (TIGR03435 family)